MGLRGSAHTLRLGVGGINNPLDKIGIQLHKSLTSCIVGLSKQPPTCSARVVRTTPANGWSSAPSQLLNMILP